MDFSKIQEVLQGVGEGVGNFFNDVRNALFPPTQQRTGLKLTGTSAGPNEWQTNLPNKVESVYKNELAERARVQGAGENATGRGKKFYITWQMPGEENFHEGLVYTPDGETGDRLRINRIEGLDGETSHGSMSSAELIKKVLEAGGRVHLWDGYGYDWDDDVSKSESLVSLRKELKNRFLNNQMQETAWEMMKNLNSYNNGRR